MANSKNKKRSLTAVILSIALAFLAVGLGTLGTFSSAGDAYELKAKGSSDAETPTVVFRLSNPTVTDEHGHSSTAYTRLKHIYVNIGAAYLPEGETATIRAEVASGATGVVSSSRTLDYTFGNFVDGTASDVQPKAEEEEDVADYPNVYYTWQDLMAGSTENWSVSTYRYIRLTSRTANVLINEVVFVGERTATSSSSSEGTGELYVLPAAIESATPLLGETQEEAAANAAALLDSQKMPAVNPYRMNTLSDAETVSMMTVRMMYEGSGYGVGNAYLGDTVYGSVGYEFLALGTAIFGMSTFGLRFFPMLAAAGTLVSCAFLARRIAKKEAAGVIFAALFALACAPLALGGLGTPLMIGVFFFMLSVNACHYFYANGMRTDKFSAALPLLVSGLAGALAILTHGAYIVPMLGVAALFVCGVVRLRRARRFYLDKAIAEAEAEQAAEEKPVPAAETSEPALPSAKEKVARVAVQYRNMTAIAAIAFAGALIVGAFVLGLILATPMYFTWVKIFDDPAYPSMNILALAATAFAGGFAGANPGGTGAGAWDLLYSISRVEGTAYSALYASAVNAAALLAIAAAVVLAAVRLVRVLRAGERGKAARAAIRSIAVPVAGIVLAALTSAFAAEAVQFVLVAYLFAFLLTASEGAVWRDAEGKAGKAVRVACWVGLGLLAAVFALCFVVTVGLPVASGLLIV